MYKGYYNSPLGNIRIITDDKFIVALNFVNKKSSSSNSNALIKKCIVQLGQYFSGHRKSFDLPVQLTGTPWQVRVWVQLSGVPFANIISYRDLADLSGNSRAARAVGGAVNKNPLPIIIPCHRVLGSHGQMVGYAGGLWRKKWLLEHEKSFD